MRFPDLKMTIFMTSNIHDSSFYNRGNQVANIYLGGSKLHLNKENQFLEQLVNIRIDIPTAKYFSRFTNEKFAGYYASEDLQSAHHIYVNNGIVFMSIKNLAEIPLIFKANNSEFWFGSVGGISGRFTTQNDRIVGMILLDFPRAPNIIWRKLSDKPICIH
jgi:hypothetical protein